MAIVRGVALTPVKFDGGGRVFNVLPGFFVEGGGELEGNLIKRSGIRFIYLKLYVIPKSYKHLVFSGSFPSKVALIFSQ